jgi:cysteine desulfurase
VLPRVRQRPAIYLDANAGAPLHPEVLKALRTLLSSKEFLFSNPSSIHQQGQRARRSISDARDKICHSFSSKTSPEQILFTSSGTDSNQWAIRSVLEPLFLKGEKPHWITTPVEHDSILKMIDWVKVHGGTVDLLPVDQNGAPQANGLDSLWKKETRLVSTLWVNNETGVVSDIQEFSKKIIENKGVLHLDAAQAWGKIPLDIEKSGAHLVSFSGHKIGALSGTGVLWHREGTPLHPILFGSQENGRRGGTENIMGIISLGVAAENINPDGYIKKFQPLRDQLEHLLLEEFEHIKVNGQGGSRVANTLSLSFSNLDTENLVLSLDLEGYSVSAGSACSSGAFSPSHVLLAMGRSRQEAKASLRVSLGGDITWTELERFVYALKEILFRLKNTN